MTQSIPDHPCSLTIDSTAAFVEAVSTCAELDVLCWAAGRSRLLAYVGMARCELTEYGARLPSAYRRVTVASIEAGLARLDVLLTGLLQDADLASALRLHEAREIVREGQAMSR